MLEVRYHRLVQRDLNAAMSYYGEASDSLAGDFYKEFLTGINKVSANPKAFHFDLSGLRRCNLERFPYHFLYDLRVGHIRVWVLRYDRRKPSFGVSRF